MTLASFFVNIFKYFERSPSGDLGEEIMRTRIKPRYLFPGNAGVTRLFSFSLFFLFLVSTISTAYAGNEILSIDSMSLETDSTSSVSLLIGGAVEVTGVSLDLRYDPSVIEVIGVSADDRYVSGSAVVSNIDSSTGVVSLVVTNTDTITTEVPVPLLNVAIRAIGEEGSETQLTLQKVEVTDTTFIPTTPVTIEDGSIKIIKEGTDTQKTDTEPTVDSLSSSIIENTSNSNENNKNEDLNPEVSESFEKNTPEEGSDTESENVISGDSDEKSYSSLPGFSIIISVFVLVLLTKAYGKQ